MFGEKQYYRLDQEDNFIHSTAIVEGVKFGKGNYVGPFCYIHKGTVIGNNNRFEAYCSVGSPPEHSSYWHKNVHAGVLIGNYCTFREYITINAGTEKDTEIGDEVIMLRGAHIGHDSIICKGVVLSCNVLIGGHSYLFQGVNMGLGSMCHQYSIIGAYSMIGMGCVITKKTAMIPGMVWVGNPAKILKPNEVGLRRNNVDSVLLESLIEAWKFKKQSDQE